MMYYFCVLIGRTTAIVDYFIRGLTRLTTEPARGLRIFYSHMFGSWGKMYLYLYMQTSIHTIRKIFKKNGFSNRNVHGSFADIRLLWERSFFLLHSVFGSGLLSLKRRRCGTNNDIISKTMVVPTGCAPWQEASLRMGKDDMIKRSFLWGASVEKIAS